MANKRLKGLHLKRRLDSKEFPVLYDAIWEGTAPARYLCPNHALPQRSEMIDKQRGGPPFYNPQSTDY